MPIETCSNPPAAHGSPAGKHLTFSLGQETYGLPVLKIREIIRVPDITSVPQMPPHIRGVINLRGKIIPVVDLPAKLGLSQSVASERTCIVVVQARAAKGTESHLGLLVDEVQEVIQIGAAEIEEAPEFGSQVNTNNILGIAKLKDKVAILLDIDSTLTEESMGFGDSGMERAETGLVEA